MSNQDFGEEWNLLWARHISRARKIKIDPNLSSEVNSYRVMLDVCEASAFEIYSDLQQQLKEAEEVIEFYGRVENWDTEHDGSFPIISEIDVRKTTVDSGVCVGGDKARKYFLKKSLNEISAISQELEKEEKE